MVHQVYSRWSLASRHWLTSQMHQLERGEGGRSGCTAPTLPVSCGRPVKGCYGRAPDDWRYWPDINEKTTMVRISLTQRGGGCRTGKWRRTVPNAGSFSWVAGVPDAVEVTWGNVKWQGLQQKGPGHGRRLQTPCYALAPRRRFTHQATSPTRGE